MSDNSERSLQLYHSAAHVVASAVHTVLGSEVTFESAGVGEHEGHLIISVTPTFGQVMQLNEEANMAILRNSFEKCKIGSKTGVDIDFSASPLPCDKISTPSHSHVHQLQEIGSVLIEAANCEDGKSKIFFVVGEDCVKRHIQETDILHAVAGQYSIPQKDIEQNVERFVNERQIFASRIQEIEANLQALNA